VLSPIIERFPDSFSLALTLGSTGPCLGSGQNNLNYVPASAQESLSTNLQGSWRETFRTKVPSNWDSKRFTDNSHCFQRIVRHARACTLWIGRWTRWFLWIYVEIASLTQHFSHSGTSHPGVMEMVEASLLGWPQTLQLDSNSEVKPSW